MLFCNCSIKKLTFVQNLNSIIQFKKLKKILKLLCKEKNRMFLSFRKLVLSYEEFHIKIFSISCHCLDETI